MLRSQIIEPLLGALDTKILIVSAYLFDAFIEDDKIHDKFNEPFLIKHGINLSKKFIFDTCTFFTDTNINRITFVLMFLLFIYLNL